MYLVRESETAFNQNFPNLDIYDFPFTSEKLLTQKEMAEDLKGSFAKIMYMCFESPIIVHNFMSYAKLMEKYNQNAVVIYCDPAKHGVQTYNQILKALVATRKEKPINYQASADTKNKTNRD